MDSETRVFAHPAAVVQRSTPTDLLERAASHAKDATIFTERPPFFWTAEISSNRLDAYFTRMHDSSLRNYAADAADGVSFQDSHNTRKLGFGQSLTGLYEEQDDLARVVADFYTIPGINLNGVSTDDLILGMRAGVVRDVSIGFYGGMFRCSICNRDLWDWDCGHIPGIDYPQVNDRGDVTGKVTAFAWVENARLAEVSAVYDGATPGAAILKAEQQAEQGRIKPEQARILEARYRIHLPASTHMHRGVTLQATPTDHAADTASAQPSEEPMSNQPQEPQAPAEEQRSVQPAPIQHTAESELLAQVRQIVGNDDVLAGIRALRSDNERLRALADDGATYRADTIDEAIREGVRANGTAFAEETYRALLKDAPLSTIKRMRADWQATADKLFPGGRHTVDTDERAAETQPAIPTPPIPDEAYS